MSLLEVSGLHVWFEPPHAAEVHAVQGVSFALDPGERFGLVGESGCGKTTTVLALMGLLPPNAAAAGEVLIDGQNILAGGEESVQPYRWKAIGSAICQPTFFTGFRAFIAPWNTIATSFHR